MEEQWPPEEGAGQGLAHRLHQEGLAGPLRWLENCLRRTAGDREEDGEWAGGSGPGGGWGRADAALCSGVSHPVPLVPLSEENEDAMEDRRFRALLRQLGLRPPASEQESFWRIPAALTPQQLRRAAASIAHHGPDPPASPQGLLEPPRCPQDPDPGHSGSPSVGLSGANPCPHCCSEEPVPVPSLLQPGTKRRRELDSEDEEDGSSGAFSPSALPWGAAVAPLWCSGHR
ncbi:TIM protein, partial [Anhinga anhinga]|nr:TIM protein [Anhinga anhinga]